MWVSKYIIRFHYIFLTLIFCLISEPFIESVPQTHLSLIVVCIARGRGKLFNTKFVLSFVTSVISASLGLSKVLLKGPVKLVPSNRGFLGGYVQLPFFLLYCSVFTCLVGKAAWLPSAMRGPYGDIYALVWFAMMIAPQATMVSSSSNQAFIVIKSKFLSFLCRVLHCCATIVDAKKSGQSLQDGPPFSSCQSFLSTVLLV